MPSFSAIEPQADDLESAEFENAAPKSAESDDLEALVDYVIDLSIRGEVERRAMAAAIDKLGYGEEEDGGLASDLRLAAGGDTEGAAVVNEVIDRVVGQWQEVAERSRAGAHVSGARRHRTCRIDRPRPRDLSRQDCELCRVSRTGRKR